jgi:hypothetical protein
MKAGCASGTSRFPCSGRARDDSQPVTVGLSSGVHTPAGGPHCRRHPLIGQSQQLGHRPGHSFWSSARRLRRAAACRLRRSRRVTDRSHPTVRCRTRHAAAAYECAQSRTGSADFWVSINGDSRFLFADSKCELRATTALSLAKRALSHTSPRSRQLIQQRARHDALNLAGALVDLGKLGVARGSAVTRSPWRRIAPKPVDAAPA